MSRQKTLKTRLGIDGLALEARDVPAVLSGLATSSLIRASSPLATTSLIRNQMFVLPQYETRLSGGTLFITGSAGADKVKVTSNDSAQTVQVEAEGRTTMTYSLADVKKIQFVGNGGNDSFVNDTAIPSAAYGGAGNDTLTGGSAADTLVGENDHDVLDGRGGNDSMWGGNGNDKVAGGEGNDYEVGGAGNDTLAGSWAGSAFVDDPGNDTVFGGAGNDWSDGGSGNDLMYMGADHDFAAGGVGNDTLFGEAGHDVLHGWEGDDQLYGGADNDTLLGQAGFDYMDGGWGYDTATADRANERMWGCETVSLQGLPGGDAQFDSWSCGPNSVSRVLRYYGYADAGYMKVRSQTLYNGDLFSRVKLGTRPSTLADVMRRWKGDAQLVQRANHAEGLEPILRVLEQGKPVVALINANGKYNSSKVLFVSTGTTPDQLHWLVVTGYNRAAGQFTVLDTNGQSRQMGFDEFYSKWNFRASGASGDFLTGTLGVKERTFIY